MNFFTRKKPPKGRQPGSAPTQVVQCDIQVEFRLQDGVPVFAFDQGDQPDPVIRTTPGLNVLVFRLRDLSGAGRAVFMQEPFLWVRHTETDDAPTPQPGCFSLRRETDQRAILTDYNMMESEEPDESYSFHVSVLADGKVYTSPDPTIINRGGPSGPPRPPGSGQ